MFVINLLPNLKYLDDRKITAAHRYHAQTHHAGPGPMMCSLNRIFLQSLQGLNKSLNNSVQEKLLEDQMFEEFVACEPTPSLLSFPSLNSSISSPFSGNRANTNNSPDTPTTRSLSSSISMISSQSIHSVHSASSTSAIWSASNITNSKGSTSPATEDFSENSSEF